MSLTITEKQHWKERIETRINAEITNVKASDPALFQRISLDARKTALEKLGIADSHARIRELDEKIKSLKTEHDELELATARKLNHMANWYGAASAIESAICAIVPAEEERLMKEHSLGKRVIELGQEKESLLDTVWLATSSPQVRELWQQVDTLLGAGSTALQNKILQRRKPS